MRYTVIHRVERRVSQHNFPEALRGGQILLRTIPTHCNILYYLATYADIVSFVKQPIIL